MLTDRDRETLEFTKITWRYLGARDAAIRERFQESPTRFHQRLSALIELPAAEVEYPTLVRRLRRVRDARARSRRVPRAPGSGF